MQLDIALSTEHPELQAPPIPLIYKLGLLRLRMDTYFTAPIDPFRGKVRRSLQLVLNQKHPPLRYTALSTSAYTLDLEVLLDKSDQPLIPVTTGFKALKSHPDAHLRGPFSNFTRSELLERLSTLPKSCPRKRPRINYASDWGWEWSEAVGRKIAVEIDVQTRYSVNDNHLLGRSVLKKRQLRALGWEVVEVCFDDLVMACCSCKVIKLFVCFSLAGTVL